jgi:hypothetical protein
MPSLTPPSLGVSFSLSEPPPPTPLEPFHGAERVTPSLTGDSCHGRRSHGSDSSRPFAGRGGSVSGGGGGGGHLMGPEDYSRSEDEEQRMLNLALERSLHIPESLPDMSARYGARSHGRRSPS